MKISTIERVWLKPQKKLREIKRNNSQRIKNLLGLILFVVGFSLNATAAPSDLDPTFGVGGKVISNLDNLGGVPSMAIQADGKILMLANSAGSVNYIVIRYNSDGSLDTTFANNGFAQNSFGASSESPRSIEIQADGKIVIGGTLNFTGTGQRIGIIRLNPDGSLDPTFDGDGRLLVNWNLPGMALHALKIASDGKIVFAGGYLGSFDYQKIVGRLNPDGSFDTTFDGDGKLTDSSVIWNDIAVQADGSIIAAGAANFIGQAAKYNSNGSKAWDFNGGQTFVGIEFNGVAAQPDGKSVMVGSKSNKVIAIRLNADGSVDNTFDITALTPNGEALSVAIQPDGKVVANISANNFGGGYSVIRYNPDGTLDRGFGLNGVVETRIATNSGGVDAGQKLLLQSDGKILVGGRASLPGNRLVIVRYLGGASTTPEKTFFDYDGDGKADVSVFRPSENKWFILRSSDLGITEQIFAVAGDIPVPDDYDGDGKADFAIFRPASGDWWYLSSLNNAQINVHFGQSGDIPRPSDFDGDGKTDYVVYRPSNNAWYRLGSTGATSIQVFGASGDQPLIGDFDGDGKTEPAIFRPSTGDWWYASSISGQFIAVHWGASGDIPVPGDYDADGKTDFVVFRPSDGGWYILYSSGSYTIATFGTVGDKPIAADYDGDGKTDVAVFRPSTGTWYLLQTLAGFGSVNFGISTDIPTENAFIP